VLDTLQTIFIALATFAIVVAFHEYGHFWMARRAGVKVLRFSIGFGRPLFRWQGKDDTEYVIAAIPLGGYVRMADERDGEIAEADLPRAHNRQPVTKRIAIAAAGPIANFLLAILVLWGLFLRGEVGIVPEIATVAPNSLAEAAGLQAGQEIIAIDGRETPTVATVNFALLERLGDSGTLTLAARYPGSDVVTESEARISQWLKGEEEPDLLGALGVTIRMPPVLPVVGGLTENGTASQAGLSGGRSHHQCRRGGDPAVDGLGDLCARQTRSSHHCGARTAGHPSESVGDAGSRCRRGRAYRRGRHVCGSTGDSGCATTSL
jgi:regulator of sigma E protease